MARRVGVQTEVVLNLAVVMVLATVVLTAIFVTQHEAGLRRVLGRSLLADARAPRSLSDSVFPGTDWWLVGRDGQARPRGGVSSGIDAGGRALAEEARRAGAPLFRPGSVWEPMRFATPLDGGRVAVARLPREASLQLRLAPLAVVVAVVVANAAIFSAFGAFLLRRSVVRPLQQLAAAARAIAGGSSGTRVAVEGNREAAELAHSFNEMTDALEGRSEELRKAVVELRTANADLRRARAGLDRAERLAAVGRLAAGVAHEVGNPMGAILAFLDLANRDPELSDQTRQHVERAGREGERVRRILRQLLDFSRPPRAEAVPLDLAGLVEETRGLVEAQRRYRDIRMESVREEGAPAALADGSAVSQILLNLILNAADAVSGVDDPRIRLIVRPAVMRVREGESEASARGRALPDAVECVVADNGCGIPEPDRERIFDPFFTSKPPGEGTGLGLANSARLAEELDGRVELVEAPEGFCTALALRLPVATAPDARGERST